MSLFQDFLGAEEDSITIDNVKDFIRTNPEESLKIEFKSGEFFTNANKDKLTICVSSFANSDGGLLFIGVKEKKINGNFHADIIDGVTIDPKHTKETLENILKTNISPKIDSLKIVRLEENGRSIFLLEIPKSERAPHMASDKRYYKRLNFQKNPMEHYEVEDYIYGRRKFPKLTARINFSDAVTKGALIEFSVEFLVRNLGKIMAKYVQLMIRVVGCDVIHVPTGFNFLNKESMNDVLQYGPFSNGVAPILIAPSASDQEIWTTFGKIKLSCPKTSGFGQITYRIMHEELPVTNGNFGINLAVAGILLAGQSVSEEGPNENFSY